MNLVTTSGSVRSLASTVGCCLDALIGIDARSVARLAREDDASALLATDAIDLIELGAILTLTDRSASAT